MRKRHLIFAAVGALCLGAIAAAQAPPFTSQAEKVIREQSGRTTLVGNVVLTVNGVVVRADHAVIQDGEVTLEGNVRLTLPEPVYTAEAMRNRITPPVVRYRVEPLKIDPPMPEPWQPPQRNQR